jgi:uncharacterized membrane protein YfcA
VEGDVITALGLVVLGFGTGAYGTLLGALTTSLLPRRLFDIAFGVLLVAAATYLVWRSSRPDEGTQQHGNGSTTRRVVEADGTEHTYSFNMPLGIILSVFVGYFSSLFGIGGGIFHVTLLTSLLNFPIHIATATSHFILAVMAFAGTATHIATGTFAHGVHRTIYLSIGVLIGAQVGARLSNRLRGVWIIRSLAIALGAVGIRLILMT